MPSKVLSTQNPIPFFFFFPSLFLNRANPHTLREGSGAEWGRRVAQPEWQEWLRALSCSDGVQGTQGSPWVPPLTSRSGKQPPGQGSRGSQRMCCSHCQEVDTMEVGEGCLGVSLFLRLLILGAGCKLVGSGSRKPRHKELEREPLPPRFWVGPPSAYPG